MLTLVLGGSASGKSEYAEQLVLEAGAGPRFYIATMEPYDEECLRRISRHRAMRASKGFETLECPRGLAGLALPRPGVALLECMSNLVANEMFSPQGAGEQALAALEMMDFEGKEMVKKSVSENLQLQQQLAKMQEQLTQMAKLVTSGSTAPAMEEPDSPQEETEPTEPEAAS